ncbi:MAG: PilZ domain-containing protein [Proteobacteria bacterium]|nr:PilZ domain-containing protein [Pseudomonadota bacterium]
MAESMYYSNRREHKRSPAANGVTAVLIASAPEVIGSVIDISMGGVKIAYHEQKNTNLDFSELKVDLISDDRFVEAIPCKNAWNYEAGDKALHGSGDLRECGIAFLDLTPNQTFLLRGFINRCCRGPQTNIAGHNLSSIAGNQ